MASDSLSRIGKYIKSANKNANLALKRNYSKLPTKDRTRDTLSTFNTFKMTIESEGDAFTTIDITFDRPPPADCAANCIATSCEEFSTLSGGHSITLQNPYEIETIRVYSNGIPLDSSQWYEENPSGGQVYVQVQSDIELIVICYTYIIC